MRIVNLTKEEFCNQLGINKDHYIFDDAGDNPTFYLYHDSYVSGEEIYVYDNGKLIRKFKFMPEYEEIWIKTESVSSPEPRPFGTLWTTWKVIT